MGEQVVDTSRARHSLMPEIEALSSNQLFNGQQGLSDRGQAGPWNLLVQDGQLRIYSRQLEINGIVCDPLKAVHIVDGVTAYEICHRFFDPKYRFEWESTLESMKVIESIDDDTLVVHQVHKRIWPATQRDAVFWSHIKKVEGGGASRLSNEDICPTNNPELVLKDVWMVTNNSTDIFDVPLNNCVRVKLTVSLICETYVNSNLDGNNDCRDNLKCKMIYIATINPGGLLPTALLRQFYQREYQKFLTTFSAYVKTSTSQMPINFGTSKSN